MSQIYFTNAWGVKTLNNSFVCKTTLQKLTKTQTTVNYLVVIYQQIIFQNLTHGHYLFPQKKSLKITKFKLFSFKCR